MNFFREHKKRLLLAVAAVVCLALLGTSAMRLKTAEGNDTLPERGVQAAVAAVDTPLMAAANRVGDWFGGILHFRAYQQENEALRAEVRALQEQLAEASRTGEELERLETLREELNYTSYETAYERVTADVIAIDESGVFGVLTVSAGSEEGVDKGDFAVNEEGLVGRVLSVTAHSCKIVGLIDGSNAVSFCLARDPGTVGMLTGNERAGLSGYLFDPAKTAQEGDELVTSGLGRYPSGIRLGTVTEVHDDGSGKVTLEAVSTVDYYSIKLVTIFTD